MLKGESWFRQLHDGRLEVKLVGEVNGAAFKLRTSGPPEVIWPLVEQFEAATGKEVNGRWLRPPRSGPKPMKGQTDFLTELAGASR